MNEDRTRIAARRGAAARSTRHAHAIIALLGVAAAGEVWAQTPPAPPGAEAKPAKETKGANAERVFVSAVLYLGDNLKTVNGGDERRVIGTLGLALAY